MTNDTVNKDRSTEALLWSVALPGFGQLLNRKFLKGILLITLEVVINVQSHLNEIIILGFQGDIQGSIQRTNYTWLMFYPCIYMFAIWDAYRDANEARKPFTFVPYVLAAYFATVGLIYSNKPIFGLLLGPVWATMIFCFLGIGVGLITRKLLTRKSNI